MADNLDMQIRIEAQVSRLQRDFDKAIRTQRRAADRMERMARRNADRIARSYEGIGPRMQRAFGGLRLAGGLLAGGSVALGVRQYTRLADAATQMQNALRVAGLEGAELSSVYEQLFASAQRNSAPIGSLVDLYSKLALTQTELGVSSDELIHFTDGIAVALKVAGTDATAASGSLLQLSQALGGGVVRAEEFNSILEGTPTIAQAVARGLKEAGGSVAELRKLVVNGEVSSRAFFRAFEVGSVELQRQAANSQTTVGQAMTRIGNSLVTVVGEFDQASGASAGLARIIGDLASGLDSFDASAFVTKIQGIADAFADAEDAAASWLRRMAEAQTFKDLNEAMGITEGGQIVNPDVSEAEKKIDRLESEVENLQAQIENNTEMGFDNTEAMARLREVRAELAAVKAEAANLPRYVAGLRPNGTVVHDMTDTGTPVTSYKAPPTSADSKEPVSIEDDPADDGDDDSGGSGGGRRSGGGRSSRPRPDDYAREVEAITKRTQALQIETAQIILAASGERDLGEAMDFARVKAELLHAAQQAAKAITPGLEADIDRLADGYTRAGKSAEDAAARIKQVKDQARTGADATADLFMAATESADAFRSVLLDLAKTVIRNSIVKLLMNFVPGMGAVGGMLTPPTGFAEGGFTGAGGTYEPAGIVHKGEYVISKKAVQSLGADNLERLHQSALQGYATGGLVGATGKIKQAVSESHRGSTAVQNVSLSPQITVNASGGTPEQNDDLAQKIGKETERAMRGLIQDEMVKQMRPGAMLGRR